MNQMQNHIPHEENHHLANANGATDTLCTLLIGVNEQSKMKTWKGTSVENENVSRISAPENCPEMENPKKICPNDLIFPRFLLKSGLRKQVIKTVPIYLQASYIRKCIASLEVL